MTDPMVLKLFKTAQLMLEYMLYTQARLAENLGSLAVKYKHQKMTLARKRKEVAVLAEESKSIHSQVKQKQKSLATLENLLNEAVSLRDKVVRDDLQKFKESMAKDRAEAKEAKTSSSGQTMRFFVVDGGSGVSMECTEHESTPLMTVALAVLTSMKSLTTATEDGRIALESMRLSYRGRILPLESTVGRCDIGQNDTVVAIFSTDQKGRGGEKEKEKEKEKEEEKEKEMERIRARQTQADSKKDEAALTSVLAAHEKYLNQISVDVRESFETAVHKLVVNRDRQEEEVTEADVNQVVPFENIETTQQEGKIYRRNASRAARKCRDEEPGLSRCWTRSKSATHGRRRSFDSNLIISCFIMEICLMEWSVESEEALQAIWKTTRKRVTCWHKRRQLRFKTSAN